MRAVYDPVQEQSQAFARLAEWTVLDRIMQVPALPEESADWVYYYDRNDGKVTLVSPVLEPQLARYAADPRLGIVRLGTESEIADKWDQSPWVRWRWRR